MEMIIICAALAALSLYVVSIGWKLYRLMSQDADIMHSLPHLVPVEQASAFHRTFSKCRLWTRSIMAVLILWIGLLAYVALSYL